MQQKYLDTLEFPKILERLARYAAFSASKTLALELKPSPYFNEVRDRQIETREADHLLSVKINIGVGGARDVRPYVARADRGFILTAQELIEIRQTLIAARELRRTLTRLDEVYPRLADIAQRIEECPGLVNAIGQAIDDNNFEVKSSASPALGRIRRELDIAHNRLLERLNRIVNSAGQYLQEAIVTQRGGRYVVPVKAEFKGRIQGVVQDQSGSGATVFVEPLAIVELNNAWRQLQLDEADEIQRILAELSAHVSDQGEFITHTVAALADLDLAFAKAKYAHALHAIEPDLVSFEGEQTLPEASPAHGDPPRLKIVAGRHPLLDPQTVVPIDVALAQEVRMLVITGPNTGGKTVSLKTVGLLAAMAQAGLRLPAGEGTILPLFEQIFADIGDEQSIEQSLSTFSGHMTNIVQILRDCDERSLVIFDELGAGTDPVEGSALARSIMLNLLERGTTTLVATHYSELKAYAHTTPGVANASMEFNTETLTPTFRLLMGVPGESNAFTIAHRLGLADGIIEQARSLVSEDAKQFERMLADIRAQTEAAHRLRRESEKALERAEDVIKERQAQLAAVQTERLEILNSARADARREIKAARERIRQLEAEARAALEQQQAASRVDVPEVQAVETELAALETEVKPVTPPRPGPVEEPPVPGPVRVGDEVFIPQFSAAGEVVGLQGQEVEVQLGRFRATVPLDGLERRGRAKATRLEVEPRAKTPIADSPGMELDLRGQIAEEALLRLDQYLDQAFMAQLPWVRIIHGKGSGVLRQAVRDELRRHPLVSTYRSGQEGEGGDGVTVAKLAVG
ncbi:MAG TPA: endonuclease MutS2 [Anaerolineae bacterium]|nr:endonuclease MutS2 [Anaerolineae bacterium]